MTSLALFLGALLAYLIFDEVRVRIHNWRILRRLRQEIRNAEDWR